MYSNLRLAAVAALAIIPAVFAQTYTTCNPLNETCAADSALGTYANFNWTTTGGYDSKVWNTTLGSVDFAAKGAEFVINHKGDAPTLESLFYIFWGRVSVTMSAASGQGIVSSIVLESDDLDEIDWEWIGGNTSFVQTNFFGKGDTTKYDRAQWHEVDNTLDAHNYTVVWTQDNITWYVDSQVIRTLTYDDPLAMSSNKSGTPEVGDRYPQTPMTIRLGIWAGGDPTLNNNGTVEWAGGAVDYSKGPFVQTVMGVEVQDFSTGSTYTYGDQTGSYKSIKVATGNSTIANRLVANHVVTNHWNSLPQAAKIAVYGGAIAVAAILVVFMTFCCIKNRRAGRKEKALADAEWERQVQELQHYKRMMVAEEEIHPRAGYI